MDKSRDMRRGATRFSRQINKQSVGHKLLSAFEKSKKEKVRKLSFVNGRGSVSSEMEFSDSSDRENECFSVARPIVNNGSSKRFKIPKKFFDDCNVVDHASIPRKQRSAMKKRNRDSVSPLLSDSKRLNRRLGGELLQKDGVNKQKQNLKQKHSQWSREVCVSGTITKDEEEVVETLYALAGMFPDNDSTDKNITDGESLEGEPSPPPEAVEIPALIEGKKEVGSVCPQDSAKATPTESVETKSLNGTRTEQFPNSKMFRMETASSIPRFNVSFSPFAKTESTDRRAPNFQGYIPALPELSLGNETLFSNHEMITPTERKPGGAFGVTSFEVQLAQERVTREDRKKGITLWPGLSSMVPTSAGNNISSQSSASKLPAWLDAAMSSTKLASSRNGTSALKVPEVATYRKPMKSCAAHVYISRLIQNLQKSGSKDSAPPEYNEVEHREGLKQAAATPHYDYNKGRNGVNGTPSGISLNRSSFEPGFTNLQHKRLHQDQPQVSQASASHTSRKSYDFLSLTAGGGGGEANHSSNKAANSFENLSRHQAPYLHPLQHQQLMPFSLPQARSTSSAYSEQRSVPETSTKQGQVMLPPYLNNPFCGPYPSHQAVRNQPQQVQQQQRLWAAQLAAHCRATGASTPFTQLPSWKNLKNESAAPVTGMHTTMPPPFPFDALGPRYPAGHHQQQHFMPVSSSATEGKRQGHHLPFVYEETASGFRAGGAVPMQLLCNE